MPFTDITGHEQSIALLRASLSNKRLAQAYLFHGDAHIGKRMTAVRLAQVLSCDRPVPTETPDSCGQCRSCLQIAAQTHPDYFVIEPDAEAATPQIKIEQIRELEQQFVYRPLIGEQKICLIDDADRMTIGAANALLKTLEEPPGHSLFILVTSRLHALPITIRSRCQALRFTSPARTQVEAALILQRELPPDDARFLALLTDGRIGEALTTNVAEVHTRQHECLTLVKPESLTSSTAILSASESLAKSDRGAETLRWLTRWIRDLVIVLVNGEHDQLLHLDQLPQLQRFAERANIDHLLTLLSDIEKHTQQATRHLNVQMALETTFFRLRDALGLTPAGTTT